MEEVLIFKSVSQQCQSWRDGSEVIIKKNVNAFDMLSKRKGEAQIIESYQKVN